MARKYTPPPKKKRSRPIPTMRPKVSEGAAAAPAPTAATIDYRAVHPLAPRIITAVTPASEAIKYENLPRELRRVALLTAACVVILIVAWLIFR